jgi:DNA mismatch repair protein MutS
MAHAAQTAGDSVHKQWKRARAQHPDAVVLIRIGDFYELFGPDADIGVRVLGLTLTNKKGAGGMQMAGIPARSRDEYVEKLVREGFRVAICEQVEGSGGGGGTMAREVVEVVTPGTAMADGLLAGGRNRFLAALAADGAGELALAAADVTTGELLVVPVAADALESELARLEPAELLVSAGWGERAIPGAERTRLTRRPDVSFDARFGADQVCAHFGVQTLDGFGLGDGPGAAVGALGALLSYLREVQPAGVRHLRPPRLEQVGEAMVLDEMTRRNLELVEPLRAEPGAHPAEGTLLGVIDETLTPMGARLLRNWVLRPLLSLPRIHARQEAIAGFVDDDALRGRVRAELAGVRDLERAAAKLGAGRITPRELRALAASLAHLPRLREALAGSDTDSLRKLLRTLDPLDDLRERIEAALADEPASTFADGEVVIRDGFHAELDELRAMRGGATEWMAHFQARERERTGIRQLKVGYNRVFGYFLEVPKGDAARAPAEYERRQTLAGGERFTTPELKEREARILDSEERMATLQQTLYEELRRLLATQFKRVQDAAFRVATLDALAGLAECAVRRRYVRPEVGDGYALQIRGGRHPVVETMMPSDRYIPNDVALDETSRIIVLTGPNMAGKSTLLRQVGLVQLLAQVGAFVPADEARVGVCDRIFTRVGASDNLVRGQSTFMVEASECATILNGGTRRSLVLMDEVGRGTATWDGVSLAWAITEYLHGQVGAKTLFATHYHELTQLADLLPGVANFSVAAQEHDDRIVFLHTLVPGKADRSYGIEVARLAGMPQPVLARAREILATLEGSRTAESLAIEHREPAPAAPPRADAASADVAERIRSVDLDRTTPLDALNLLAELRRALRESGR